MEVALREKDTVWRGRGRPRREIPAQVAHLADQTYRTHRVGVAQISSDEEEEARELVSLLTSYARSKGKRMVIQREEDELRFEMVDYVGKKKGAKK